MTIHQTGEGRVAGSLSLLILSAVLPVACVSQPPRLSDLDLVLRMEHLESHALVELPLGYTSYEKLERERWVDGAVMVEYEFEPPEASELPYLYSAAEKHPSSADACMSFHAVNLGSKLSGVDLVDRNDVFEFGAQSRFALLVHEGEPYGNLFAMCDGKMSWMVVLAGIYFDDGEAWGDLILPVLEALPSME